jgi:hypothetical protein
MNRLTSDADSLRASRTEMHLDPRFFGIVEREVIE